MNHLNGDIMCAVDVETTGLDIQKHHFRLRRGYRLRQLQRG